MMKTFKMAASVFPSNLVRARTALLLGLLVFLTGCGQKGPLRLPESTTAPSPAASSPVKT
ncbi:LPS translocon maturation chaperone LptM [Roseateles sp.]|uniref:LPS translocon maturation chaperone LptM n=1 Tax=Roseateles sp. TaxID=1971397 RepID=UPI00286CCA42|nr:lipoprotein [Roseateles sp.]